MCKSAFLTIFVGFYFFCMDFIKILEIGGNFKNRLFLKLPLPFLAFLANRKKCYEIGAGFWWIFQNASAF